MSLPANDTNIASKSSSLPQFMNENNVPSYSEMDVGQSWLTNNLHRLMIGVSAVWFAIVLIYITQFFGWSNLFLMMPDEFGGFLAGITLPLAIIWVVMAYIDRGTSFKQEAKFLRAYMNQLVYPEDGAPQTAKAMADAIRSQVVELQQVTKLATQETAKIKDEIGNNINEFSKLIATLDTYSSKTIVELSEGVKFLVKNFETISSKAENSAQTIAGYNRSFIDGANDIENNLNELFEKLLPRIKEIKSSAEILKDISDGSNHNILRANELLTRFNQEASANLNSLSETLGQQTAALQEISKNAVDSCSSIRKEISNEFTAINAAFERQTSEMRNVLKDSGSDLKGKIDELTRHAMENCGKINADIAKGLSGIDAAVSQQVKKIDDAMARHGHELLSLVKALDEQSETVNQKFSRHGENLAQEIDKIMVRSSNLQESIAIQVDELSNVSDNIAASMQKVSDGITVSVNALEEKSAAAGGSLNSYLRNLEENTARLEEKAAVIFEKSSAVADNLVVRHSELNGAIDDISDRMENLSRQCEDSAEELQKQAKTSVEMLNQTADNMTRHTQALNEATSIVVAQSQVSEASLAQQQRNITLSANRVEEIKAELKLQIEELSKASASLESNASLAVDKLKNQISVMLDSCEDVIGKSRAINDNLAAQSDNFDTSTNRTLAKVTQLQSVLQEHAKNIDALSRTVSERSAVIDEILSRQNTAVEKSTKESMENMQKAVASFETQNQVLNDVSRSAADYVAEVSQTLEDKVAALNVLFRQQENEFIAMSDKLNENTSNMNASLKKNIATLEQSADKVFSRIVLLEEDTNKHAEAVAANSSRSIARLSEVEDLISAKNDNIAKFVNVIGGNFESMAEQIQNKVNLFDTTVKNIVSETGNSVKTITSGCKELQTARNQIASETSGAVKLMDEQAKAMDVALTKAKMQASDIKQIFAQQQESLTEVINTLATQTRLGEASMAQQYKYLTDTTTEVAQKMKEINDTFKNNTDMVFDTSTKIAYEFDVLGDRLIKAGEDIAKSSKASIKNIEQVNMTLSQCGEDLDATIHHSVENIGGVFKDYEKYIAGFNTVTAETSSGVIEINNLITEQSDKMVKISEDTKKLVDCFNTVLNETSNVLSNRANIAYDKVKGLGENLKNLSLQLEEATKLSAAHFENSGDKLRATISEISANAERISNEIRSSGEVFIKQSNVLVAATEDTVSKVHTAMNNLVETGREFSEKGDNIVKQTLHFNDVIDTQIKLLTDNTKKADATLKDLTKGYSDIKIDGFLQYASGIIEKLEALSVDINRVFNPKDEDDLWKKFYNGDTGVFTRYLAKNMTKQQIASIRKEYEKSGEFRALVGTYLSEFEVLVSRAKEHEHSGVLLSVISGADIGKLYYILAKTLDKIN